MADDQRPVSGAQRARGQDELAVAEFEERRAGQPGEHGQEGHADGHHADGQARPEDGRHEESREDGRESLHGVHEPHEALVEPAAEVAGEHAERHADPHADPHRDHPDQDGGDGTGHDAGEEVAAELIGAERMGLRGALEPARDGHLEGIARRVDEAHRRRGEQGQGDHEADREGGVTSRAESATPPLTLPSPLRGERSRLPRPGRGSGPR